MTSDMVLGISSYTFTWAVGVRGHIPPEPLGWIDILKLAKDLGIRLVQIADNMPLHKMADDEIDKLIKTTSENNIGLEAGANRMTPENLETYLNIAERIRSRILRFVIDGEGYKPDLGDIISIIRNAEPEFKKRGITLALENHDRFFARQFLQIIEKVSSPYLGVCLDCANSIGAGEGFKEVVTMLAPHAVNFHLKEVSIKRKYHMMGFDVEGKPFGEGSLPLEWMLSQLPSKCRTAILEQWTPPEETLEKTIAKERIWAEQSIKYLRRYFSE
jgi:sugar phosphate isomerase/epimerase